MKYINIIIFLILVLTFSCKQKESRKETETEIGTEPKMLVTHYYSVKMENGIAVKDSLKDCFSCNQAEVYDRNGKQTELRFYKSNMTDMYGYEIYNYNDEGYKTGSKYFEGDSLTTIYKYDLDNEGRILKGLAFNAITNEPLYGYLNEYDENGNHISTGSLNSKEEVIDYYKRTFNDNGIVVLENIVDIEDNPTFKVKYEYRPQADENWTEQLTYYNDELKEIRYREEIFIKDEKTLSNNGYK